MAASVRPISCRIDQTGLLVFGEGTGDLAHHLSRRVVARGQIITRGHQQPHRSADQEGNAQLWAISSRAKRDASSTMTVRTPLPSMRSRRAVEPGRS